jgi:hypothetical protein
LFHQGQSIYQRIKDSSLASNDETYQKMIDEAFSTFFRAWSQFNNSDLISTNDILEDLSTSTMKYLLIPFYLGDVLLSKSGMDGRLRRLRRSMEYLNAYLDWCVQFDLIEQQERKMFENPGAPRDRTAKIEQLRRENALKDQTAALIKRRDDERKRGQELNDDNTEEDEIERELTLLVLRGHVIDAVKHLQMSTQELPLLEMMEQRKKEDAKSGGHGKY